MLLRNQPSGVSLRHLARADWRCLLHCPERWTITSLAPGCCQRQVAAWTCRASARAPSLHCRGHPPCVGHSRTDRRDPQL